MTCVKNWGLNILRRPFEIAFATIILVQGSVDLFGNDYPPSVAALPIDTQINVLALTHILAAALWVWAIVSVRVNSILVEKAAMWLFVGSSLAWTFVLAQWLPDTLDVVLIQILWALICAGRLVALNIQINRGDIYGS